MKFISTLLVFTLIYVNCIADEGMWLPHLLKDINEKEMQVKGLKLTAEDLYSVNKSSLKDAVVSLGGFCTAEFISDQGLLLTNHHCAVGQIQSHSSTENDYLQNGFWAMKKKDELPNKGLTVSLLVDIVDVTDSIIPLLSNDMTEQERNKKVRELSKNIIKNKTKETLYSSRINSFYGGNAYYMMTYETFKDVRLVGAPPSSIGKFGGDTDNWMWPRHTGDFALFRVYCAPDGTPAEYSKENVPYKPRHHFPIQLDGVENGDYTMIFGFPGSTDRYLTSYGVRNALDITYPERIKIRAKKLEIIKNGMSSNEKNKIKYAAKYAQISNYWKYYIGQTKGLNRMNVQEKKLKQENEFNNWVTQKESRQDKYSEALPLIDSAYNIYSKIAVNRTYLNEAIFSGPELLYFSYKTHRDISNLSKDKETREKQLSEIKKDAVEFYKDYDEDTDKRLFKAMLEMYYQNVPLDQHAPIFKRIANPLFGSSKKDFKYYTNSCYNKSIFSSSEKFFKFINYATTTKVEMDPIYKTMSSIYSYYLENIYPTRLKARSMLAKGNRLFISGMQEMQPEKSFYPDANSTLRVTYGNVGEYIPGDAVKYDYYTTIEGIIEKENPTNEEFIVPSKLKTLYQKNDYDIYADENGTLRVNFISNNDITGGNSGSPVINAWGEIVGTAFDGNWEAMSGDIAFENEVQRTISVDIRYVLFIISKFAGANHLIDEMTIAKSRKKNKL